MDAREGQVAVEVACKCEDTLVLVNELMVAAWSCAKCRSKARPTGRRVVLGVDGALPADWRDQRGQEVAA